MDTSKQLVEVAKLNNFEGFLIHNFTFNCEKHIEGFSTLQKNNVNKPPRYYYRLQQFPSFPFIFLLLIAHFFPPSFNFTIECHCKDNEMMPHNPWQD